MAENSRETGDFEAALRGGPPPGHSRADQLCLAAVAVLPADGCALSVFLTSDVSVPAGASDDDAARADDLQFALGEGPGRLAYRSRRPVHVRDVRHPGSSARAVWPVWAPDFARLTPYRSVSAVPLLVGGSALGTLTLFSRTARGEHQDAALAAVSARVTCDLLGQETPDDPDPAWLETPVSRRRAVWKAQGITMRAQGITARQALTLLRAHALAMGRPLVEVAQDVVQAHLLLRRPET